MADKPKKLRRATQITSSKEPTGGESVTTDKKKCSRCERLIFKEYFKKDRESKDGLSSYCRQCSPQYNIKAEPKERFDSKEPDENLPTVMQMELLLILNPYNHTKNYTYAQAAKVLNITEAAVTQRMACLKQRCPITYARFIQLKKDMNAGSRAIKQATNLDPAAFKYLKIKEYF